MYPSYYEFSYILDEASLALLPGLISGIPSGLFRIASFVLTALALYTIAKRRCISHPWLAWVPVANLWLLGSLSDQYRYVVKGQIKSRRKALVWLKLISICLSISVSALALAAAVKGFRLSGYGNFNGRILEELLVPLIWMAVIALPLAAVSVTRIVIYYMALYDVYTSCDPENNVLFTVLSVFFHVTKPFFLFFNRNKDLGMPPRREQPQYQPEPEEPQQPSWENREYL